MHRTFRTAAAAAACVAVLAACSSSDDSNSPARSGSPSSSGAPTADEACQKVVALIGFADHWLLPAGQEDRQVFDDAARGAIAEVVGTVDRYGTQLPVPVQPAAERLVADGRKLVPARAAHQTQVTVLRDYHEAAQQVVAGCASTTAG